MLSRPPITDAGQRIRSGPGDFHEDHSEGERDDEDSGQAPDHACGRVGERLLPKSSWLRTCRSRKEADLVIEAVPEVLELKKKVWAQIDSLAPKGALLATNSSSIPVSRIESATQRPEKCLNIHFYQPAIGMNIVDVMGGTKRLPRRLKPLKNLSAPSAAFLWG